MLSPLLTIYDIQIQNHFSVFELRTDTNYKTVLSPYHIELFSNISSATILQYSGVRRYRFVYCIMNVSLSSSVTLAQQHLGRAISNVQRLGLVDIGTGSRNLLATKTATTSTTRSRVSLALGIITSCTGSAATFCAPNKKDDSSVMDKLTKAISGNTDSLNASLDELASSLGNQLQGALDSGIPTQLSYGFVSGYCSGLALKKVGRAAAVVFGTFLVSS
jgi:hypothetical protein